MSMSSDKQAAVHHPGVQLMHSDGTAVVLLRGEIDMRFRDHLESVLTEAMAAADHVVVDLSHATFIDSTTLNALVIAHRAAGDAAVTLTIRSGPDNVMRALTTSGIDQLIAFTDRRSDDRLDTREDYAGEAGGH
jgi:anti-anti-sigma factor